MQLLPNAAEGRRLVGGRVRRARTLPDPQVHPRPLPAFSMRDRLDATQTIGAVVQAVAQGRSGVRPAAVLVDVPYTTARGWVRSFVRNASRLAVGFSALCVELGDGVSCLLCLELTFRMCSVAFPSPITGSPMRGRREDRARAVAAS